jgi:hypothetical protein
MLRRTLPFAALSIAFRFTPAQAPDTSTRARVDRIFAAYDRAATATSQGRPQAAPASTDTIGSRGVQFRFTREKGKPNGFTVDAGRTRNLRFDRTK